MADLDIVEFREGGPLLTPTIDAIHDVASCFAAGDLLFAGRVGLINLIVDGSMLIRLSLLIEISPLLMHVLPVFWVDINLGSVPCAISSQVLELGLEVWLHFAFISLVPWRDVSVGPDTVRLG